MVPSSLMTSSCPETATGGPEKLMMTVCPIRNRATSCDGAGWGNRSSTVVVFSVVEGTTWVGCWGVSRNAELPPDMELQAENVKQMPAQRLMINPRKNNFIVLNPYEFASAINIFV